MLQELAQGLYDEISQKLSLCTGVYTTKIDIVASDRYDSQKLSLCTGVYIIVRF